MKTTIITGLILALALLAPTMAAAQDDETRVVPTPEVSVERSGEAEVLIGDEVDHGGFGGPTLKLTRIHGESALMMGGRGGWLIDHVLMIGGGGYGLVSEVPADDIFGDEQYYVEVGYGGPMMELILFADQLLHFSIEALIGGGGANYSLRQGGDDSSVPGEYRSGSPFFVIESGLNLEINVTRNFRMTVGSSYRYVDGVDLRGLTDADLSGFAGTLQMKFGAF